MDVPQVLKNPVVFGIIVAIIIIFVYFYLNRESYTSKREKATTINEWFSGTGDKSYTNYREQVPESDIIDYTSVKNLASKTVDNIEKILQ